VNRLIRVFRPVLNRAYVWWVRVTTGGTGEGGAG
jgi:hypothetical protein